MFLGYSSADSYEIGKDDEEEDEEYDPWEEEDNDITIFEIIWWILMDMEYADSYVTIFHPEIGYHFFFTDGRFTVALRYNIAAEDSDKNFYSFNAGFSFMF